MKSPDAHGEGFATATLDPLRYGGLSDDPWEAPALLRAMMPSRVRVLDVGCGCGPATEVANHGKDNEVHGIEPDAIRAEVARARGIAVTCGYLSDDFIERHGLFDVVMFADVLEHVPDPGALLTLALRGLKPEGVLLISVPNVAHWTVRWQLLWGNFNYMPSGIRDATHLRWFTRKTVEHLLASLGLEILDFRHSAGLFTPDYDVFPWNRLPRKFRAKSVHAATRFFPLLFGCQHVLKAKRRTACESAVKTPVSLAQAD
jgi:SAM-dependent methyltransferase